MTCTNIDVSVNLETMVDLYSYYVESFDEDCIDFLGKMGRDVCSIWGDSWTAFLKFP